MKWILGVIVCADSYLYTDKKNATPLYVGVGVSQITRSKNGTRSNRDPKYDALKCHTHGVDFLLDQMI